MAYPNKEIHSPVSKQSIRFIRTGTETNGELLEMVSTYLAHSNEPMAHYHPSQKEDFEVLEGELTVRTNGKILILKKGDRIHIPEGQTHSMWNDSDEKTVINWQVRPAMNTDNLLEMAYGLASEGKVGKSGRPSLLQTALMANHFSDVFRMAKPPFVLQKVLFGILTPIARMLGYRATYDRYFE